MIWVFLVLSRVKEHISIWNGGSKTISQCLDVKNDEKSVNSRIHTLGFCLLTSVSCWNIFLNSRQSQRYRNHRLGLLKNQFTSIYNTYYWKNAKLRGKNRDIWKYEGPVFPYLYSDLTKVLEWTLCVWRKPTVYDYGRYWKLKLVFVAPKLRLRQVKKGHKRSKMKNCVLQKILFYFSVFTSWK